MHYNFKEFEQLLDPAKFHSELDLEGYSAVHLVGFFSMMTKIRMVEMKLAKEREDGAIGGPVHLGVGQEAVAVGLSSVLSSSDKVFGTHRSHAHLLALGGDIRKLFAEILGKNTGHSKGMGGSMHLWDEENGFYGSVPIVAGTVSLAVGAGLAAKLKADGTVAVAYLGDGAVEEGVVHESLNFSSVHKVPIVFVVENNLFASHLDLHQRQPSYFTARFALANNIPFEVIDGNDVTEVCRVANLAINTAKNGMGSFFIEAITYRWLGHVDWRDDIDVGVNRSAKDLNAWKLRDPIKRLEDSLMKAKIISKCSIDDLHSSLNAEIESAWSQALLDPYPDADSLINRVFA